MELQRNSTLELVYSTQRHDPDYAEVLPFFIESLPEARTMLIEFAKASDFESLRREAHRLRGTAGGYGYEGLSKLAGHLEDKCKDTTPDTAIVLQDLDKLIEYLDRIR